MGKQSQNRMQKRLAKHFKQHSESEMEQAEKVIVEFMQLIGDLKKDGLTTYVDRLRWLFEQYGGSTWVDDDGIHMTHPIFTRSYGLFGDEE